MSSFKDLGVKMVENLDEPKDYFEEGFTYPFLEIRGIKLRFELDIILSGLAKFDFNPNISYLDLGVEAGGKFVVLGRIGLELKQLLSLYHIKNYQLILHNDETNRQELGEEFLEVFLLS